MALNRSSRKQAPELPDDDDPPAEQAKYFTAITGNDFKKDPLVRIAVTAARAEALRKKATDLLAFVNEVCKEGRKHGLLDRRCRWPDILNFFEEDLDEEKGFRIRWEEMAGGWSKFDVTVQGL